eukprot:Trichotokara_eunicae@DN2601_c0_g1_i1.p1
MQKTYKGEKRNEKKEMKKKKTKKNEPKKLISPFALKLFFLLSFLNCFFCFRFLIFLFIFLVKQTTRNKNQMLIYKFRSCVYSSFFVKIKIFVLGATDRLLLYCFIKKSVYSFILNVILLTNASNTN